MKAMSALALAAVGLAGVVAAQTTGQHPAEKMQNPPSQSFRDECGFRYNNRGDRIDERGRVMSPPMTPPNGRSCK